MVRAGVGSVQNTIALFPGSSSACWSHNVIHLTFQIFATVFGMNGQPG